MAGINFLQLHFPFGCKVLGQNFACFSARQISGEDHHAILATTTERLGNRSSECAPNIDLLQKVKHSIIVRYLLLYVRYFLSC